MTALEVFTYADRQVRTVVEGDDIWFVAADVCTILEHTNPTAATGGLDSDERGLRNVETPSGVQSMVCVSEAGLYSLIIRSRKPEAKQFRRWVTHEVLPSIRRTGSYGVQPQFQIPKSFAEALRLAADQTERAEVAEAKVAELEPAAAVAKRLLLDAEGDLSVADTAKVLARAGVDIGPQRLFNDLALRGWIFRQPGDQKWRPYTPIIQRGYLTVIPQSHYHPKTGVLIEDAPQVRVTTKGIEKLLDSLVSS